MRDPVSFRVAAAPAPDPDFKGPAIDSGTTEDTSASGTTTGPIDISFEV